MHELGYLTTLNGLKSDDNYDISFTGVITVHEGFSRYTYIPVGDGFYQLTQISAEYMFKQKWTDMILNLFR